MPATTSAAGTSISRSSRAPRAGVARGFTLIELMVVVVIIAIVSAGAMLAIGVTGKDSELERESERLVQLMNYTREQAELQTREYGLRFEPGGYRFVTFDPRKQLWRTVDEDDSLRLRELPEGLQFDLVVEGRSVVVKPQKEIEDFTPQIMIFSNGDRTSFEVTLRREAGASIRISGEEYGDVQSKPIETTPT